jgi:hypothetical protein
MVFSSIITIIAFIAQRMCVGIYKKGNEIYAIFNILLNTIYTSPAASRPIITSDFDELK